jgi:mercuric ion binding protein
MKRILIAAGAAVMLFSSIGAHAAEKIVTLTVVNMYCATCPYIVKRSLARISGVADVTVSFAHKTAKVTYDDRKTSVAALTAATRQAGYPSQPIP